MSDERQYAAVEVVGRAGGMNQAGWEGAIADNECSMLYNMGTNIDGEWSKRKGYRKLTEFTLGATLPTLKLHWHTDEASNQATGATWVETGDEVTAASSGALVVSGMTTGAVTLESESIGYLRGSTAGAYISMKSAFNFDAACGRLKFYVRFGDYVSSTSTASTPPSVDVYLFYGSSNFNIYLDTFGDIIWEYGAGLTINAGPLTFGGWHTIDIRWDNEAVNATYPERFKILIDGGGWGGGTADPAAAVTLTLDTDVYFYNTGSAGTSAPVPGNIEIPIKSTPTGESDYSKYTDIALISSWSSSGATATGLGAVTGIHNNSSQQRAVITAGNAATPAGKVFYSPSWTLATGVHTVAGVRTAATECQGNIYITDGTTNMFYLVGTGTGVITYVLPETAKWIEEYHGHLWIAGLGTSGAFSVRASTIDDFVTSTAVSWPSVNQIFKCRDTVRGIKAYGGQLVVGTRSTIEAISGYNPQDFTKTILATGASCASHWSMKEIPMMDGTTSALIWAGYDGMYMLYQNQVTKISWPMQDFWDTLSKVEIEESHAVDCRSTGEYLLAVTNGVSTDNNCIIVYNYRKGTWSLRKYAAQMDVLGKYYKNGEEVILGGDSSGGLHELNFGDDDNGAAIDGYLTTKWHDGGLPDQDKDFRRLYVWADSPSGADIEVGWSVDYTEMTDPASIVAGTDGNDYICTVAHEPSVVVGTDGNDYYCTSAHTSSAATCPITGASYATVWTATGTTGRGETWATATNYTATDTKRPITGAQYALYWEPRPTTGNGTVWSAMSGYHPEEVQSQVEDAISADLSTSAFGVAVFGTDVFATAFSTLVRGIDLRDSRGKAIRLLFRTNGAGEPFKIRGYKVWFTYVPEFPA